MSLRDRAFLSRALRSPPLLLFRAGNIQDFADSSLGVENKGFQMLRGLGWEEGAGLGAKGAGRLEHHRTLHRCKTHAMHYIVLFPAKVFELLYGMYLCALANRNGNGGASRVGYKLSPPRYWQGGQRFGGKSPRRQVS